jgi:rhodanese-related sulfurtransferase
MMATAAVPELTVDEAAELIAQSRAIVIDVNPRRRWSSGHIPGALNLDPAEFTETHIPGSKDATLIFYCIEGAGNLRTPGNGRSVEQADSWKRLGS